MCVVELSLCVQMDTLIVLKLSQYDAVIILYFSLSWLSLVFCIVVAINQC